MIYQAPYMFKVNMMKQTTGLDTVSFILTGILMLLLTLYTVSAFIDSFKPTKSREQYVIEHIIHILYYHGALTTIGSALNAMNHPDADLFYDAYITLSYTRDDNAMNNWMIQAILTLSSNINNRINTINVNNGSNMTDYINDNYQTEDSDADATEDEDVESTKEDDNIDDNIDDEKDEADESEVESGEMPESTSPVRMARALTHYSNDSPSRKESSTEDYSNDVTPPNNTPHQSDVESNLNSDNSSVSDNSATGDDLSPENAVTIGDSVPSEAINDTSESNTNSVEQSGNSENTSENS
jgi:hypothetical protein